MTTHLYIKRGIEAHLQMTLIILVEHPQEALLEYGSCEGVRQHDDPIRRIGQGLHLQQTDLVETASKQVDGMAVIGCALGQAFVELVDNIRKTFTR
jgi:hypothetical protein